MKKEKYIWERQSKKGKYLRVYIRKDDIKKQFGVFYFDDYPSPKLCMEAAKHCRDDALRDIKYNRVAKVTMTVYEAYIQADKLLINSIKSKERNISMFKNLIPKQLQSKDIVKITTADVQDTINQYSKTHSDEQVRRAVGFWKKLFKAANMNEIPVIDRTSMIIIPKSKIAPRTTKKECTREELEEFLDALLKYNQTNKEMRKVTRDIYYMFRIMQHLGLRPQEVLALSVDDIDLNNRTIHISHSVGSDSQNKKVLIATKTHSSDRNLPISDELYDVLLEFMLALRKNKRYLFTDKNSKLYDIDYIGGIVNRVCKKKNVPHVTMYMMRHMFSTEMLKATSNDTKVVQSLMGHESAAMTLRYARLSTKEEMKEALEKRALH